MTSERYTTGLDMLQRVDGKGGDAVVKSLQAIAPDFARYLIEFPFMQMAVYAGFPAALNGLFAAKEVFAAH